jgi:hypothetical protein
MNYQLVLRNFEIQCSLDKCIEFNEELYIELISAMTEFYPSNTRLQELDSLLLYSPNKNVRLIIDSEQIIFSSDKLNSSCEEAILGVINEWKIISRILDYKGKADLSISGMYTNKSNSKVDLSGVIKLDNESVRLLGKGEITKGIMFSVKNTEGSSLISITNYPKDKEPHSIQFSKNQKIDIAKLDIHLKKYCEEIDSKLIKVLEKNFN